MFGKKKKEVTTKVSIRPGTRTGVTSMTSKTSQTKIDGNTKIELEATKSRTHGSGVTRMDTHFAKKPNGSGNSDSKRKIIRLALVGIITVLAGSILYDQFIAEKPVTPPPLKPRAKPKPQQARTKLVQKDEPGPTKSTEAKPIEIKKAEGQVSEMSEVDEVSKAVETAQIDTSPDEAPVFHADLFGMGEDKVPPPQEAAAAVGEVNNADDSNEKVVPLENGNESMEKLAGVIESKNIPIESPEAGGEANNIDLSQYKELPNYEQLGRGLVYNCVGNHWACVDKDNYYRCIASKKLATDKQKVKPCVEFDVYSSIEDCQKIQIFKVNTQTDSGFCE